jgi:S-DNA-T family DNA segregation ATPase FtsK/SpoIIIE
VTTLRTPPFAGSTTEPTEGSILDRQRATIRELARIVAERAAAEAEIARTWPEKDAEADREYQERRKALQDRFEGNKAAALHDDSTRRRAISDASIAGEAAAKDEFAKASRKIASEFDHVRENARSEYTKSKSRASVDFDGGEKAATAHYATARKPIDDAFRWIESGKGRLASLFEEYRHFGLPEAPTAATTARGTRSTRCSTGSRSSNPTWRCSKGWSSPRR